MRKLIAILLLLATPAIGQVLMTDGSGSLMASAGGEILAVPTVEWQSPDPNNPPTVWRMAETNVGLSAWSPDEGTSRTNHLNWKKGTVQAPTHITVTNSPSNMAFRLDGIDDNMVCYGTNGTPAGDPIYVPGTNNFKDLTNLTAGTEFFWFKPTNDDGSFQYLTHFGKNHNDTHHYTLLDFRAGHDRMHFALTTDGSAEWGWISDPETTDVMIDQWNMIAIVQDGVSPTFWHGDGSTVTQMVGAFSATTDTTAWFKNLWFKPGLVATARVCVVGARIGNVYNFEGDFDYYVPSYTNVFTAADLTNAMTMTYPPNSGGWNE